MAKLIRFYIPACHHQKVRWVPKQSRGKLLPFPILKPRKAAVAGVSLKWQFLNRPSRSAK